MRRWRWPGPYGEEQRSMFVWQSGSSTPTSSFPPWQGRSAWDNERSILQRSALRSKMQCGSICALGWRASPAAAADPCLQGGGGIHCALRFLRESITKARADARAVCGVPCHGTGDLAPKVISITHRSVALCSAKNAITRADSSSIFLTFTDRMPSASHHRGLPDSDDAVRSKEARLHDQGVYGPRRRGSVLCV